MDDDDFDFTVLNIAQCMFQSLDCALYICLYNDVQIFQFPFLDPVEDIVQGNLCSLLFFHLSLGQAGFCHAAGNMFFRSIHDIPGVGYVVQAQHFYRRGRRCLLHLFPTVIHHGSYLAIAGTGQDGITDVQRTSVNEDSSYRASAFIQLGFNDGAVSRQIRVCLQFQHICD